MNPGADKPPSVNFTAPLLVWRTDHYGEMAYVAITGSAAEEIRGHELLARLELGRRRGFGSVKITASIGDSRWSTSVFPQKEGGWFLPVKKAICRTEDLHAGDDVTVTLELL